MKYSQYSRKRSGGSAFYIVIALCLVVIGAATWFAFSRMDNSDNIERGTSSIESEFESKIDEYSDDFNSYIESEPPAPSQDTPTDNNKDNIEPTDQTASAETQKVKAYTMPVNGEILKDFSTKTLQYSATYNDMRIHAAVDIAAMEGTLVGAAADGEVLEIENTSEYGKTVTIDHGDGLVIKYCGLKNVTAQKDTPVKMGDSIGAVGTIPSECSDQSHLHIEAFQNGKAISFLKFFN